MNPDAPIAVAILAQGLRAGVSCGEPIGDGFRCPTCRLAAWLALGLTPPEEE